MGARWISLRRRRRCSVRTSTLASIPLQVAAKDEVSIVRRVGATVLVLGGLLEAGRLLVFSFISPVLPPAVGALIYAVPSTCIGVAPIVLGLSYFRQDRIALVIAGGLNLVTVVVNLIQVALHSPSGPAPSQLAALTAFLSIVAAAIVLLADRALSGPPRWAMGIPALAVVILLITLSAPVPAVFDRANVLVPIGFAAAGALLLRPTATLAPRRPKRGDRANGPSS